MLSSEVVEAEVYDSGVKTVHRFEQQTGPSYAARFVGLMTKPCIVAILWGRYSYTPPTSVAHVLVFFYGPVPSHAEV